MQNPDEQQPLVQHLVLDSSPTRIFITETETRVETVIRQLIPFEHFAPVIHAAPAHIAFLPPPRPMVLPALVAYEDPTIKKLETFPLHKSYQK